MRRVRRASSSAPRHWASNGRSDRLAFAYPADRRKNASRESGSHLRSWTPGRISVWSLAHSLGRSSDRNAFAYGSSRIWSLWRWMTPRMSRSRSASSRTEVRYGQTCALESRSHIASMSPVRTNVSGRSSEPPATIVVSSVLGSVPSSSRRRPGSAIRADAALMRRSMASLWAARSAGAGRSQGSVPVGRWVMSALDLDHGHHDPPPRPEDGAAGGGAASRLTIHRDRRGQWATARWRRAGTGAGRPGRRGPPAGRRHRW